MRAVTSAEEPAGTNTVISSGPRWGKGGSCASASRQMHPSRKSSALIQDLLDFDSAAFPGGADARKDHGERSRAALAVHLRRDLAADSAREFFQLLDDGIVLRAGDRLGAVAAAL